jgi:hypothetical protein
MINQFIAQPTSPKELEPLIARLELLGEERTPEQERQLRNLRELHQRAVDRQAKIG